MSTSGVRKDAGLGCTGRNYHCRTWSPDGQPWRSAGWI